MTAPALFLPLSIIQHRSALEQCDYRPGLGRKAGLTRSESPDAAIYGVDVFQGFRSKSTLLKTPTELFCTDGNTHSSFCAGEAARAITRRCLESNQRRSSSFLGFLELGATAAGRQSLAGAGCGVSGTPAPEHRAHLVPESEGGAGEQQGTPAANAGCPGAFLQPQRGEK